MKYIDDVEVHKPTITVGTHFFRVNHAQGRIAQAISNYAQQFNQIGPSRERRPDGRPKFEVKARFYSFNPIKNEFRFHIEQLNDLLNAFERQNIGPLDIDIVSKEYTQGDVIDIEMKPGWTLRDYQVNVKDFILNKDISKSRSRLASLPTGTGKTVIALGTAIELKTRIAIPVPAGYGEKWVGDVLAQYNIDPSDTILIGSGAKDPNCPCEKITLKKLLARVNEGTKYKCYVLSQETLASLYKAYETAYHAEFADEYGCEPEDLFETLGTGVAIIDETHEAINMVFKMMMYMNIPLVIGLSGTLRSREQFILRIQSLMYPSEIRYDSVKMKKYIHFFPTTYTFANFKRTGVKTMAFGSNMYSQAVYEASIYKNKNKLILKNFLEMIDHYLVEDFIKRKKPGKKCAIYLSRIELCSIVVAYLKQKHPDMDIRKYTSEDPYSNAIDSEVRVTTRGSCGTAIDIKGLTSLITFDNVDSDVGNLQLLGRLREDPDVIPYFRQLYCDNIPKHIGYQKTRHATFSDRIANCKYERYSQPLDVEKGNLPLSSYV